MSLELWIYFRLGLGILIVIVGLICFVVFMFQRRTKASTTFFALVVIGMWFVSGGKLKWWGLETEIQAFSELVKQLPQKPTESANVTLLARYNDQGVAVWWKLLQYRIEIRALLRDICNKSSCQLKETDTSFSELLKLLVDRSVLESELASRLDKIRAYTYYFEWRSGNAPNDNEVRFVLENSPSIIKELQDKLEDIQKKVSASP